MRKMERFNKRSLFFLIPLLLFALLMCILIPIITAPKTEPSIEEEIFEIPSLTTIDFSAYYTRDNSSFNDSLSKYSLSCQKIENATYVASEDEFLLPGNYSNLRFQCTWTMLGNTVYIGFLNTGTGVAYIVPFVSGTASGLISISGLPDGNYEIIMYSNRNFSTTAVLGYQFI